MKWEQVGGKSVTTHHGCSIFAVPQRACSWTDHYLVVRDGEVIGKTPSIGTALYLAEAS